MARTWTQYNSLIPGIPHVQDVGATVHDEQPYDGINEPPWLVGSDGSLWFLDLYKMACTQVPSPGELTRVAVSPDGCIWCVNASGALWRMQNSSWSKVDVPGEKIVDVGVSADRTVWLLMANGRYYTISPGGVPFYHGVLISLQAITGVAGPSEAHPYGRAWGVSPMFGDSVLCRCETTNGWSPTNVQKVRDLSASHYDGLVWVCKSDGSVWTTTDGVTQMVSTVTTGMKRIAAGTSLVWAVANDGSVWVWMEGSNPHTVTPPPPPPLTTDQAGPPPSISVTSSDGGVGTVFRITGTGFLSDVQVTIRGARIDEGQIHQFYWLTTSSDTGTIQLDIPLPCVPGVVIDFSANDGRRNPNDLTDRLWSNTVPSTCP